jgi:hypothetical protein
VNSEMPIAQGTHLTAPNRIRVETALSRFPIHRLTKKGTVSIDLQRLNEMGFADFKWEVTYNSKHGQPGPLAYKVDTLVINRLLDQLGRPLPELIKIGSLSDVCRFLGTQDTGPNIANVKAAFLQNASAFINAKIRYKLKNGREKWGEVGYTRYSVIFTGEALPDGRQADGVHIILNPPYRELLNQVETRPLDYEYLRKLPPGSQRLYELLSFQMYGAIASGRPRAKMLYSDYCKYAPQVRYMAFNDVKKQMYKLHLLHRRSGYISKIEFEKAPDEEGNRDWEIFYTPGPKAFSEYEAFTNRQSPVTRTASVGLQEPVQRKTSSLQTTLDLSAGPPTLFAELTRRGIGEKKASELLAAAKPHQQIMDQLEYVDFIIAKDQRGKIENPPGLYVFYIRDNILPPAEFLTTRRARLCEEAHGAEKSKAAYVALESNYDNYRVKEIKQYIADNLTAEEYRQLLERHRGENSKVFRSMTASQIEDLTERSVQSELIETGQVNPLSFDAFCKQNSAM